MAITPVEVPALPHGMSGLTLDVYDLSNDIALESGIALTVEASRTSVYTGVVTANASGVVQLLVRTSGGTVLDDRFSEIEDTTTVQIMYEQGNLSRVINSTAGTGARTVTITVDDGTTALENAKVRMTEGLNSYNVDTNISGVAVFNLDDATYTVSITKSGYSYAGTTLVVDGTEAETYSMTAIAITPSSDPTLSVSATLCVDETGTLEEGVKVHAVMESVPTGSGITFDSKVVTATSDVDGILSLTLVRLATYKIKRGKGSWVSGFVVPDTATFELDNLLGAE